MVRQNISTDQKSFAASALGSSSTIEH